MNKCARVWYSKEPQMSFSISQNAKFLDPDHLEGRINQCFNITNTKRFFIIIKENKIYKKDTSSIS